ncbi:MAG: 30S ribosomal protein S4 [Minisyncoccia bacterium]
MSQNTRPVCRKCRREGAKLFLKGDKCFLPKCPFTRRSYQPGNQGAVFKKYSDYGLQLREKQKAKRIYGVSERQFKKYFLEASREQGKRGEVLLQLLERRLDNLIYRAGLADSRREARLLVSHNHFLVNDKKVNIPSYLVKPKDKISLKEKSRNLSLFKNKIKKINKQKTPPWLKFDVKNFVINVLTLPRREEIDTDVNEQLIIEFYSR